MPPLVPNRFLVRVAHPCPLVKDVPRDSDDDEHLVELPEHARIDNFAALDEKQNFADVRFAWNDFGIAVQVEVTGKKEAPVGDSDKPSGGDGLRLWIDTRDSRTGHRGTRFCHQFSLFPTGGGADKDEPFIVQQKINRALQDAPSANIADVLFRAHRTKGGYRLEAFFPVAALNGYDPAEHPRLGVYYYVRDSELGDQFLSVGWDFPFGEDPSLWAVLELVK